MTFNGNNFTDKKKILEQLLNNLFTFYFINMTKKVIQIFIYFFKITFKIV